MKKYLILTAVFVLLSLLFVLSGCSSKKQITGNFSYRTECMGTELDGSATVKAWGNGRNYFDACEQAKKNAVRDVLFKGIIAGNGECNAHPLVPQVNAQERFETYFNKFFRDGGEYKNFVSLKDERIADKISRHKINTPQGQTHGIVLRILRAELKEKLINDGIIKN